MAWGVVVFNRRWLVTTLLVVIAMVVMARLGIWQLERLEQRRAFNSQVLAQINQPAFELNSSTLTNKLVDMEYRSVVVRGQYAFGQEMVLRNQVWNGIYGVHLLTPLIIEGTDIMVLVDRGWIPAEDFELGRLEQFRETGTVEIHGVLRRSMSHADFGQRTDPTPVPGEWAMAWNLVNLELMSRQTSKPLLPVYIQQSPDPARTAMPFGSQPVVEISEGPHLGYAVQWFTFTFILGAGYPVFVYREEKRVNKTWSERKET
jgi:surfeit locus 1 family protein